MLTVGFLGFAVAIADTDIHVWPMPRSVSAGPGRYAPTLAVAANVTVTGAVTMRGQGGQEGLSPLLERGLLRAQGVLRARAAAGPTAAPRVDRVTVRVLRPDDEVLGLDTDYSYTLVVEAPPPGGGVPGVTVSGNSSFGVLAGLESLCQLAHHGSLGTIVIEDRPMYRHRGLMLDAGRRFHPVPLVKSMLEAMATVKLSVLHFHLSDQCRFAVESKRFPELTARCVGDTAAAAQGEIHFYKRFPVSRRILCPRVLQA